jgi:hypothetical protein
MRLHDAWHIRLEAEREAKIKSLEEEIARLRLTDAERELLDTLRRSEYLLPHGVKIIDGLLERLGNS